MEGIMELEVNGDYYENLFKGDDQEEIRFDCDDWLEDELISDEIDFYEIKIERSDGYEFKIWVFDESGDYIGNGCLKIKGEEKEKEEEEEKEKEKEKEEEEEETFDIEKCFASGQIFTR